ncbi:MAG: trypsin-like peptidase domain-containing protein, partial [Candidatus Omnitrophica bacterium]|nr:trypsin-like peptidase domain-containing protein [Candidatus Omnitrophota bacterium]
MRATLRIIFWLFLCLGCCAAPVWAGFEPQNAVVKVIVAYNRVDPSRPWQSQGPQTLTGSGVILSTNQILTNAHVVADHTFINIKKADDPKTYTARVIATAYDCDLALLTVDDRNFYKNTKPLTLGGIPKVQDSVTVLGYPEGGDKISITKGVVSRIEVIPYAQSSRKLLAIQIDAAINPGNSGGAVIQDGRLVGVAMQSFKNSQGIGYIIPVPIIEHFFADLRDGSYDGFPLLGIDFSDTENPAIRKYYGITNLTGGVLINNILPYSPGEEVLKEGDIVLAVDGVPISQDGTFHFRPQDRLTLTHLITQHQIGDTVKFKIVRKAKPLTVLVKIHPFTPIVPYPYHFQRPPYMIYGGMIFTVLSMDLLSSFGDQWWEKAPSDLIDYLAGNERLNREGRREIVVLLGV